MSTTTPGSFAALQNMRVAPMGQSLDDPSTLAGSGMYVVLDGRLKAKREQETREAVERLQATSRRSGSRKAWGAGKGKGKGKSPRKGLSVGHAGVGVSAADVRASADSSPFRRSRATQGPASPDPTATGGSVDVAYVRQLQSQMETLQRTVKQLQESQESVGVDPGFLSKIDQLKRDHSKNVSVIERLFKEKQAAERKAKRLEERLRASGGRPAARERDVSPPPPAAEEEEEGEFDFAGGPHGGDESAPPDPMAYDPNDDFDVPTRARVESPSPPRRRSSARDDADEADDLAASKDDLSWARRVRDVYLSSDRSRSSSRSAGGSKRRPQSAGPAAGRRSSKATKPKPFMMTVRDSSKLSNRRQQELEEKRRAELEQQAEEEALRLRRSRGGPFKGLMQREEERLRRVAEREAKRKEEERLAASRQFKANPVPRSMVSEDYTVRKEAEERARRERIAKRSQELLSKSQMPPRMKLREVSTAQQRAAAQGKAEAKTAPERQQGPPKPKKVPDFDRLKRKWEHKLTAVRMKNQSTKPQPFNMEDRQRVHDAKREERLRKREEKEAAEKRAQAERERRRRAAAMRAGPKGTQATTKSVELRMQAVKKAEEAKALEAERVEREERARKAKQERASRELRPVIAAMEKERKELMDGEFVELQNVVPGADGEIPEQARELIEKQQSEFRQKRSENKQKIKSALSKRPTLFERSEIQRRSEDAKRKALATIAQNIYSSSAGGAGGGAGAGWREMANDDDLLDPEEKALMGLDTVEGGAGDGLDF